MIITILESYLVQLQESKIDEHIIKVRGNILELKLGAARIVRYIAELTKDLRSGTVYPEDRKPLLNILRGETKRLKKKRELLAKFEKLLKFLILRKKLYKGGKIGAAAAGVGAAGYGTYKYLKSKKDKK